MPSTSCRRAAQYLGDAERVYAKAIDGARVRLDGAEQRLTDRTHRIARRTHAAVGRADEGLAQRIGTLRRSTRASSAAPSAASRRHRRSFVPDRDRFSPPSNATSRRSPDERRTLDPVAMLERGWTITRRADGVLVRSSTAVAAGDVIDTLFADGHLLSTAHGPNEER